VGFCEIEPYCQKVLRKHWPDVPIYDDVRELTGETVGPIDIITGGYPCQPFSVAGKRRGEADDRHLWPEFARLIRELRPRWVLGENVAGHINMGLDDVLADLEREGYAWESFVIPACAKDAPHRRDRVWTVAYTGLPESSGRIQAKEGQQPNGGRIPRGEPASLCGDVSDSISQRGRANARAQSPAEKESTKLQQEDRQTLSSDAAALCSNVADTQIVQRDGGNGESRCKVSESGNGGSSDRRNTIWTTEPSVGRVAHGIPKRVDRLRGLGNAIVPQIAEIIFKAIDNERYPQNSR